MSKKRGLGKGLDALLKSDKENIINNDKEIRKSLDEVHTTVGVSKILLSKIKPNPDQPRKVFNDNEIKELAETIKSNGLINPLTLRCKDNEYQLVSGERRFRALQSLGMEEADAIVIEVADEKMLEITLIENIQRADLNAVEIALSYRKLIDDFKIKHDDLAKRIGRNRSTVTNSMRILELSDSIKQLIIEEKISEGHARALLSEKDEIRRERLAIEIVEKSLSVRDIENIVKIKDKNIYKDNEAKPNDPNLKKIENDLEKIFATKVNVVDKNGQSGKIVIEYYSSDDLIRIIDILEKDEYQKKSSTKEIIEY